MNARQISNRTRSDLRWMVGDVLGFSLMVGVGESYFAPFALALGLGDVVAGLIATAPMLAGALLQLVSPAAVAYLGSHKRWVVLCAALQAASFVPLVAGALAGGLSTASLYASVALYWGLGLATGPAWNTWVSTLVPESMRTHFFARRNRWAQAALLVGLLVGGGLLDWTADRGSPLLGFGIAFAIATFARGVSVCFLASQSEPLPVPLGETRVSPAAIRAHLRVGGHGRLLAYLIAFHSGVWIAAPYFTPFMLGPLNLNYFQFTALTASAFLARIAVLPALGRLTHRRGTRRTLRLASIGIVPLPALWLVSDSLPWLFALQILGGVCWAAFELTTLLSFFEHIPLRARTSLLSVYNLAHAGAIAFGSVVGGILLGMDGGGYVAVMLVSALMRAASLLLLRGVSDVVPASPLPPPARTVGLRPSAGALERPVVAAMPEDGAVVRAAGGEDT